MKLAICVPAIPPFVLGFHHEVEVDAKLGTPIILLKFTVKYFFSEEKVNGGWCEWHPASFCNVSCGYGHQEVVRYCSCPGPKNGGSYCNGTAKAFHPCHATNCSSVGEKSKYFYILFIFHHV